MDILSSIHSIFYSICVIESVIKCLLSHLEILLRVYKFVSSSV
jgi:hypothetical protein